MRLHHHTAISLAISGTLYLTYKSAGLAIASLFTGIFIDLDHIPDVIREHGGATRIREFFRICNNAQFDRIVLICHGWEWLIIWSLAAWSTQWNPWITGAFLGLTQHIILDSLSNSRSFLSYSLLWRWKNKFHFDTVFPRMTVYKYKTRNP